ncbi:DNA helicase UvrD [Chromobacterium violaceum]|uniref:UvrD-helicase domain-containing protein n=1 Tax=Chromobacterium violaceum TaxID=536 RepID=UPI000654A903|nr:UvrD-helicase domain-containing protein [Chromobacterium violaceum]KMN48640.1 DNA helicase UvrD [Chromobacterium violaceum]KMN87735.1 DNA helicase UvrD [Chromobacterium violaceum]KMN88844.1 DNA helicase UvrD [Chromobacterium violaceum]KMO05338.1 DNA helicase UvrD [Chromobacterium violaceum]
MTPFQRARVAAQQIRERLFEDAATSGIPSKVILEAMTDEDAEDFEITLANPSDSALGGADAVLLRRYRQIVVRNDVPSDERGFLIAHELGHWALHPEDHDSCHKVIDSTLSPENGDTFGAQKVEAYGARERAELQANIFARELLLPREVARALFLAGKTALQLQQDLDLPLELVRQQLLDGLLLPNQKIEDEAAKKPTIPTDEQRKAAESTADTSLVVAGPGTGKTTTLLMRVQHLLSQGIKPSEILLLTFSNRAARELVDRLQALGVKDAHDIWVGTFHAFGLEFLRKNHEQFGLRPRFGVADKMAQIAVLEPHIYGLGLTAFNPLGDPLDWLNEVVKTIQRAKDELADVSAFTAAVDKSVSTTSSDTLAKQRDIIKLYKCYETKMRASGNLVDMGDLVMLPAVALRSDYAKFHASVGRFKHILVDEYQDVNRASAELVKALAIHAESLWVVGDARQAIYRFRGASMRNIVRFGDDFPDHKIFPLNENRRSYEEIIRVFEHTGRDANPLQIVLPLDDVEPVRGSSGIKPRHVQCANDDIAQGEVASHVRQLHSQDVPYRNQVVLASTHETCGTTAHALNAAGIPALHLGDIFQRPEIKDLLSLLQLFVDRSGSGLLRATRLPGLEMPPSDVELLLGWLKTNRPMALSWLSTPPAELSPDGIAAVKLWSSIFHGLNSADSPWDVACSLLLDRTAILRPYLSGDSILEVTRRLALWQFIYYLRVPDGSSSYQTLGSFVTRLRRRLRVGDDRELRAPPPEAEALDAVAVMTIHQSKGLEFEAVHLVDIDARHFSAFSDHDLVPSSLLESIASNDEFEAETEASNKLYVALSRAKRHLVLYETKGRYDAECVAAVINAAHLFEHVQGSAVLTKAPSPPTTVAPGSAPSIAELSGLLTYRVCPRRYYYDFIRQLTPTAGLHPAAQIEVAVMADLFAPHGTPAGSSPNSVDSALSSLTDIDKASLTHLQSYAEQLISNGRAWLAEHRVEMPKPIDITCNGMPLRITPHRVERTDYAVKLSFVRVRPFGRYTRQSKVLRWVLMQLAKAYPKYSFTGEIFTLSTGTSVSVSPYTRLTNDTFAASLKSLLAGDFPAKTGSWECPRCRHFTHCPA